MPVLRGFISIQCNNKEAGDFSEAQWMDGSHAIKCVPLKAIVESYLSPLPLCLCFLTTQRSSFVTIYCFGVPYCHRPHPKQEPWMKSEIVS